MADLTDKPGPSPKASNGVIVPDAELLPFEDLADSLYLHQADRKLLLTISNGDGHPKHYQPVERFMELQKERDQLRRLLALINAWRLRDDRTEAELVALLRKAGLTDSDADTMNSVIDWAVTSGQEGSQQ